jgi:hypothetical protein
MGVFMISKKTALGLVLVLGCTLMALPSLAEAPKVHGLDLMNWAKKVDEGRYNSPRDFDETIRFFEKKFRGWKKIKQHPKISLVGVRYVYFENLNPKSEWEGFNVYEMPNGRTRIFVIPRKATEQAAEKKDGDKTKKK